MRKVVFVGDSCVGKTTMMIRQTSGRFPEDYVPTVFDNYSGGHSRDDPLRGLTLWDTAGGEDYDRLRPLSYPNTDVVVICFSTINPASLINVETKWVPEVCHHAPGVPFILVCTKIDLRGDNDVIRQLHLRNEHMSTYAEGKAVAKRIGAFKYMETSSISNAGLPELFLACQATERGTTNNGKFGPVCVLL